MEERPMDSAMLESDVCDDRSPAALDVQLVAAAAQLLGADLLALAASHDACRHFQTLQADFVRYAEQP
jgi:hypothetical protein